MFTKKFDLKNVKFLVSRIRNALRFLFEKILAQTLMPDEQHSGEIFHEVIGRMY